MHVLITTQVFPPEAHPTSVMVAELAEHLVARGHDVTVAAGFPHHPAGRLLGGYRKRWFLRERKGGVAVLRGWHLTSSSRSIAVRAAVMVSQALAMATVGRYAAGRPDVVVSYGPPFVGALLSARIARRFGVPLLTVIYDIYPDVAVESGKVRNPLVIAAAKRAERRVYERSDRILVLSEGFRRTMLAKGVPEEKLFVLPVWLPPEEIRPSSRENGWRAEMGISPSTFVVLYAGTVGIVSGASVMVDVATRLKNERDLLFLFVGEGQVKDEVAAEAQRRGLGNMRFLPLQERSRLNEVQATSDLSVVTLAPGRGRTSVPSKVVGYLAAGRPVLASVDVDSDTAECVRSAGGVVVPPGSPDAIASAVLALRSDAGERAAMGASARRAFERDYAAPTVLERYAAELERLGGRKV